MDKNKLIINSPIATSGAGFRFENHVQASFVALMLTGGRIPSFSPDYKIHKVKLQRGIDGYKTDDLIVFTKFNNKEKKLLINIKSSVQFTKTNKELASVINSAWQDFNNTKIFDKNKDKLALATGPLNNIDTKAIPWILGKAKCTENVKKFLKEIRTARHGPPKNSEKLEVIKYHLENSNNNSISDDELYEFLKNWSLLNYYDLGEPGSVILSLLYSHIAQIYQKGNEQAVWDRIFNFVSHQNKYAGTIDREDVLQELEDILGNTTPSTIQDAPTYNFYGYENNFVVANLIGSWDENNDNDLKILKKIFGDNYDAWNSNAREVLNKPDNKIISLKNGVWKIAQTKELYNALSRYVFDDILDKFKEISLEVLKEEDPAFELSKNQRYMANIYGKNLKHSRSLRNGITKGLALLGNTQNPKSCSANKQEDTTVRGIHEILSNANWQLWGSLNGLMPMLAEASPYEFLSQIEEDLQKQSPEIPKLFLQEGDGITGYHYLTGLLWGLEILAWDENLLVRVCIILAKLANIDPGGQWSNRPFNSLQTILLPWSRQTIATIDKRKVAVDTICDEYPNVGWDILISFLPNNTVSTFKSYKPKWRCTIPSGFSETVTNGEYEKQIDCYARKLILLAENKVDKLTALIENLYNLPKQSFDDLLCKLSSESILNLPKDKRLILWQQLNQSISKHNSHPNTTWSFKNESIKEIEKVAYKFQPADIRELNQHIFSYTYDTNYPYKENENYKERDKKITNIRKDAIKQILNDKGIESVIEFAKTVESPGIVGESLALVGEGEIDSFLFPDFLNKSENELSKFIFGYVWDTFDKKNWQWVDTLNKNNWKMEQICQFLTYLPFCKETWNRAKDWLKNEEKLYWRSVNFNPHYETKNLNYAIEKLLQHKRPNAAIRCLNAMKQSKKEDINIELCVKALTDSISSQESNDSMTFYEVTELIKVLQDNEKMPLQDMMEIEWSYLPLLDGRHPKVLNNYLSNKPEFFCEIIQSIYRSENTSKNKKALTEKEQNVVHNARRLLRNNWRTLPGVDRKGFFNGDNFNNWLTKVKEICTKSGHLEAALYAIGKVLIHSPKDASGLFINKTIAKALNEENANEMRNGYYTGILNSRGVCSVDPTGKQEFELSKKYQTKANEIEDAGFSRLATTLREISKYYERMSKTVLDRHEERELE